MLICLQKEGIGSILVEGGTSLLNRFIEANLWDEARVCTSAMTLGKGIKAPAFGGNLEQVFIMQADKWTIYLAV